MIAGLRVSVPVFAEQVIALGRLGWPLRRIEEATGVRRETASRYLRAAGVAIRGPGRWGRGPNPAKEGMPAATFTWWRTRLRRAVRAAPPGPGFTEVVLAGPPVPAEVEVVLRNGRRVRVPLGAECGAVRQLIEAFDAPC